MKNQQISLFNFTAPELSLGIVSKVRLQDPKAAEGEKNPVVGMSLTIEKRKDLAKRLGLNTKTDSAQIDAAILALTDKVKEAAIGEFAQMAASPDWTGGRLTKRVSKSGKVTATMNLVSCTRQTHTISREQLVEAMRQLKEDEQLAIVEAAQSKSEVVLLEALNQVS